MASMLCCYYVCIINSTGITTIISSMFTICIYLLWCWNIGIPCKEPMPCRHTVDFRHFIVFVCGLDPGTLKSDIVSKKHPQLIRSDLRLSNWKFEDWNYGNWPYALSSYALTRVALTYASLGYHYYYYYYCYC